MKKQHIQPPPKQLWIILGFLIVVCILVTIAFSRLPSAPPPSVTTTSSSSATGYLTPQQTVSGLASFLTLQKVGDVGGGIAWEGTNTDTGTRVRVITDKAQEDKVTTVYVWVKVSNMSEATNRISFSILKTVASNTVPDSISWLQEAYTAALKAPGENQEKMFGDKQFPLDMQI